MNGGFQKYDVITIPVFAIILYLIIDFSANLVFKKNVENFVVEHFEINRPTQPSWTHNREGVNQDLENMKAPTEEISPMEEKDPDTTVEYRTLEKEPMPEKEQTPDEVKIKPTPLLKKFAAYDQEMKGAGEEDKKPEKTTTQREVHIMEDRAHPHDIRIRGNGKNPHEIHIYGKDHVKSIIFHSKEDDKKMDEKSKPIIVKPPSKTGVLPKKPEDQIPTAMKKKPEDQIPSAMKKKPEDQIPSAMKKKPEEKKEPAKLGMPKDLAKKPDTSGAGNGNTAGKSLSKEAQAQRNATNAPNVNQHHMSDGTGLTNNPISINVSYNNNRPINISDDPNTGYPAQVAMGRLNNDLGKYSFDDGLQKKNTVSCETTGQDSLLNPVNLTTLNTALSELNQSYYPAYLENPLNKYEPGTHIRSIFDENRAENERMGRDLRNQRRVNQTADPKILLRDDKKRSKKQHWTQSNYEMTRLNSILNEKNSPAPVLLNDYWSEWQPVK